MRQETKDDIQQLIEMSNDRFESLRQEMMPALKQWKKPMLPILKHCKKNKWPYDKK
jgi:hypothetical protein